MIVSCKYFFLKIIGLHILSATHYVNKIGCYINTGTILQHRPTSPCFFVVNNNNLNNEITAAGRVHSLFRYRYLCKQTANVTNSSNQPVSSIPYPIITRQIAVFTHNHGNRRRNNDERFESSELPVIA